MIFEYNIVIVFGNKLPGVEVVEWKCKPETPGIWNPALILSLILQLYKSGKVATALVLLNLLNLL
jgi:hypothetical protein